MSHHQFSAHLAARFQSLRHLRKPARLNSHSTFGRKPTKHSTLFFGRVFLVNVNIKKGSTGFQARDWNSRRVGAINSMGLEFTPSGRNKQHGTGIRAKRVQ